MTTRNDLNRIVDGVTASQRDAMERIQGARRVGADGYWIVEHYHAWNRAHPVEWNEGGQMNFGQAVEALKAGKMVRRVGWNGKGMHLYLEDGFSMPIRGGVYKGAVRAYEPVICMFTAQQKHQPGWLASQADMLAEDWDLVDA